MAALRTNVSSILEDPTISLGNLSTSWDLSHFELVRTSIISVPNAEAIRRPRCGALNADPKTVLSLSSSIHTPASLPSASAARVGEPNTVEELQDFTDQVEDIVRICDAVAKGDLTRHITFEARGELLDFKHTVNGMVARLRTFVTEVTRPTSEVDSPGYPGGCVEVVDIEGV
ncbi:hypothetical protein DFS33DRAFT_1257498 [Desarmillaria ectypa]|nr:hypothetical protein DFS33DRAFT_1257498 [Desarmillaria ectypa]